jgi:hypothetical protein
VTAVRIVVTLWLLGVWLRVISRAVLDHAPTTIILWTIPVAVVLGGMWWPHPDQEPTDERR